MAAELSLLLKAIDHASGPIGDVNRSLNKLEMAAGDLHGKALQPLNNLLGGGLKLAAGAAVTAIGALGVVIGSSVKASMDMEQQLADITAFMGTTAEETGKLKKLIMDLGFDPKLAVSATEAADAIQVLGTAGLSVDEILDGAARSTVLLANSTGAEFADAATIATNAMAQFGIEAKDMQKAVDGISGVTVASTFDINDYRLALSQAGGVAGMVGVEFDDFNATIAAISPYFASGSDAGTSFKTFLQRLVPDTKPAIDAMRELGLFTGLSKEEFRDTQKEIVKYQEQLVDLDPTSKKFAERQAELTEKIKVLQLSLEEGQNAFFNADGSMKSMSEITGVLHNATKDLSEEQKIQAFSTIFGTDAMRAAGAVAGMTEEDFLNLKKVVGNTDAEQQAAIRTNTYAGMLGVMSDKIESVSLMIGDEFKPIFQQMTGLFIEQINIHGPAIIEMFRQLAGQMQVGLEKLTPWVQQALPKMIEQIPVIVTGLVEFVRQVSAVAVSIFNAVAPVVSFVANLVGLKEILYIVGGLMAISAVASVISFVASIAGAVSAVAGFVGALGGTGVALAGVLAAIGPVLLIVAALGAAAYALYVAWQNNFLGIRDITGQVFAWIRTTIRDFPNTLASARDAFYNWGSSAINAIRDGFLSAQGAVRNGLDVVVDFIQRGRDERLGPFAQSLFNAGQTAFGKLAEGFRAAGGAVSGEFNRIMTDVQNQGAAFAAGAFAGRMYESARAALLKFGEGLRSAAPNLGTDMSNALNGMVGGFNTMMGGFRNHVYGVAAGIGGRIRDGLASVQLYGVMETALRGIGDAFNHVMDSFRNHVWGVMTGIGGRIGDGLAVGIRNSLNTVLNALNWITSVAPQWVRDALGIHSPSTVFAEIGEQIMMGLTTGLQAATAMPEMALATAAGGMLDAAIGGASSSSTVNRNVTNTYQISNTSNTQTGDPIEQVRALRGLYGGAR